MIKLLSVAIFAGLFIASQARPEPNTTLPEVPDAPASYEPNTPLPEVPDAPASYEPNTPLPEVPDLPAGSKPNTNIIDVPDKIIIKQCWTQWYDRDDPSGTGDWETLSELRKENPGKICPKPAAIDVQTLTGLSVAATGDVIYRRDTTTGFICRNQDQRRKKMCNDYRVRFSCPPSCVIKVCWTQWFDRDDPSGTGDYETLSELRKENPGKICPKPAAIEVQTLTGLSVAATGDVIYRSDTTTGFVCRNKEQLNRKKCNDYRVRFICPPSYCG